MHGIAHWIMQYALAAVTMFLILLGLDLVQGARLADGVWISLAWALASAAIFTAARYSQSKKR